MPLVKRSDDPTKGDDHDEKIVDDAVGAQQERMGLIVTAIDELKAGTDDFIGSGAPDIGALELITGFTDISAKERDDAWETYNG
jgi:hypothetical protein